MRTLNLLIVRFLAFNLLFVVPKFNQELDYSKLALESQDQLHKLRSEVDQVGLKYLTPQN